MENTSFVQNEWGKNAAAGADLADVHEGGVLDMIRRLDAEVSRLDHALTVHRSQLAPVLAESYPSEVLAVKAERPVECEYAEKISRLVGNVSGMCSFVEDLDARLRL